MMLQACASGYEGAAATVYALLDPDTDMLVISKVAKEFRRTRFQDCAIVTNMTVDSWESWFTDDDLAQAINAFQRRLAEGLLTFHADGKRADPANSLQVLKVDATGKKYEINEITNAQIATLMLAWHVERACAIKQSFAFGDFLNEMKAGNIVTY